MNNPLRQAMSRCRRGLRAALGFSMAANLLMLTVAIYMLQVYDRVLSSQSLETLVFLSLIALGALILLGFFDLFRSRVLVRLGVWMDRVLSPDVLRRALELSVSGQTYRSEALRDLSTLRGFLAGAGINALFDAPWVPVFLGVIFLLHPTLGVFAVAGALCLFALALANHLMTQGLLTNLASDSARNLRAADAAFRNTEAIDGMAMGDALARRWDAANARVLDRQTRVSDRAGTFAAATKSIRLILQVGVLGIGAWLVIGGRLSPGGMIAASILLGRALAPVEQAIGAWKQIVAARGAWRRLDELYSQPPVHPEAMPLPRPSGRLTAEAISWSPAGMKAPILRNVSFSIQPGEAVALIGPSAAGKSSLARLMVGIGQPQQGRIRLDGADVFAMNRHTFGQYVGYLPQDIDLFPGSVRENIARMGEGDPDLVVEAARMAGVHEMILRLPHGYETPVGEQGAKLSGGQRQRIGLARALYGDPVIVVLDEPNSNLDAIGDEALNAAILNAKTKGTTVVLVAHRPSLMAHVDRILVMNDGQIHMSGPRDEILSRTRQRPLTPAAPVRVVAQQGG